MAIKKVVALLTLVALAASHVGQRKVVGGTDAVTGEFPYIVSLRSEFHICGGSILDKNHILSAAHCVQEYTNNPELLTIQYGTADISIQDNLITVVKITIHSEYDPGNDHVNDIAVLKLECDIDFGANAQPVKLPSSSCVPPGNVDAVLIGWGKTASVNGAYPLILNKVKRTEYRYNPNYHVCAGTIRGGKGHCEADSGGPLTINGVQYGIVSWSAYADCGNAYYPGILTSVAKYLDWIQEHIQD